MCIDMGINHMMFKNGVRVKNEEVCFKARKKKIDTGSRFRASGVSKSKRNRRRKKVKTG